MWNDDAADADLRFSCRLSWRSSAELRPECCSDGDTLAESKLSAGVKKGKLKDAKTRLQEYLQARGRALPKYEVVDISGAAHEQVFHVSCSLGSMGIDAMGSGPSKREAQQQAAMNILESIEATENKA